MDEFGPLAKTRYADIGHSGFHPLLAFLDGTGEAWAGVLRPGNVGSNTAADHVTVLTMALAQLPVDPGEVDVVARADSAGLTHGLIDACINANVRFNVGHDLTEPVRTACLAIPTGAWEPAVTAGVGDLATHDHPRPGDLGDVGVVAVVAAVGAQLTFTDIDGRRFQTFITNQTDTDITYLEALQRGRGRAEKLICNLKDTGCTNLPSADFQINAAWLTNAMIAHDLLIWCQHLCLDGDLARAEPKRLRYTLLHAAGLIARTGRQTRLRIAAGWRSWHRSCARCGSATIRSTGDAS